MIFKCECGRELRGAIDAGNGEENGKLMRRFTLHKEIDAICNALIEGRVEVQDRGRLDVAMARAKRLHRIDMQ